MEYKNITLEKDDDGIVTLTLNRPGVRNAIDRETWMELKAAIHEIRSDPSARAVIITGAGEKAFASGADLNALKQRTMVETLEGEAQAILSQLENLELPVIAAVNGFALGGGCELAMACDIRVASENARFGQPEVNVGIMPGAGGTQRLSRLVGFGRAKYMIMTGDLIDAREAERIGLVSKVVPQSELMAVAKEIARKILSKGPLAIRMAKMVMNIGHSVDMNTALALERLGQTVLFASEDRIEGMAAFLEKRSPIFKGK